MSLFICNDMELTSSSSKYIVDLSEDLNDTEVSLLIDHGLGSRFPAVCDAWRSRDAESKETAQKSIFEEKQHIDKELKNNQPLLEDALARGMMMRILDACPCVLFPELHLWK